MTFIRSLIFNIVFYSWTFVFLSLHAKYFFVSRKKSMVVMHRWAAHAQRIMNIILKLYYRVEGLENLKDRKVIIAAKHQSAWDTFIYPDFIEDPCMVVKKELTYIPLYGHFIKKFKLIAVDRSQGAKAIKTLIRDSKRACFEENRPIVIFPEGTRSTPGQPTTYQPGVAAMYNALKVPVIPVAVNSGLYWGRRHFIKKPGTITLKFLPPIEPGLNKKEFMKKLEDIIEKESNNLLN